MRKNNVSGLEDLRNRLMRKVLMHTTGIYFDQLDHAPVHQFPRPLYTETCTLHVFAYARLCVIDKGVHHPG